MAKNTKKTQKVIRIPENKLIGIIDNIVREAVAEEKKGWLSEQAKKTQTELTEEKINSIVESRVEAYLTKKFSK